MPIRFSRRQILQLAALPLAAPLVARPASAAPRMAERMIRTPQGPRHYLQYVPDSAGPGAPVVFTLHGGGGSMRQQFSREASATRDWPDIAAREGFILVSPNGTNDRTGDPAGDNQHWNDARDAKAEGVDDVGFLSAVIDRVVQETGADPRRIYLSGASNGGMMVYRMLTEAADRVAGGVAFVANLPAGTTPRPARPVPVMIVNGTRDRLMPYAGGSVANGRGDVISARETARFFVQANGLNQTPQHRALPNPVAADGCRMIETRWEGAAPVILVTVEGGGHQIPHPVRGTDRPLARRLVGPLCRDAHGLEMAWDFLKQFRR